MAKLLSNREMELFRHLLLWRKAYQDSNPDVGMGPSLKMLAEELVKYLSFEIDEDDIAEVCEDIRGSN